MATSYATYNLYLGFSEEHIQLTWQTPDSDAPTHWVDPLSLPKPAQLPTLKNQEQFGRQLFERLFPPGSPCGDGLRRALERNTGVRLRLVYPTVEQPGQPDCKTQQIKLLAIPWEYLFYAPAEPDCPVGLSGFLCQSPDFSLVHHLTGLPAAPGPRRGRRAQDLPLSTCLLAADALAPDQTQSLTSWIGRINAEASAPGGAKAILQLEHKLTDARIADFQEALLQHHIVFVVSHGQDDGINLVDGVFQNIAMNIPVNPARLPRALVIAACHSAEYYQSVAAAFHRRGVPVVAGFTAAILLDSMAQFTADLSLAIVRTACGMEEAVSAARRGLARQIPNVMARGPEYQQYAMDWGRVRLFLAAESGALIPDQQLYGPVFPIFKQFTRQATRSVYGDEQQKAPEIALTADVETWIKDPHADAVMFLHGPSGAGKSTQVAKLYDLYKNPNLRDGRPAVLFHFCQWEGGDADEKLANNPLVFVRDSLYPQLEKLFGKKNDQPRYRQWVGDVYPFLLTDGVDALHRLVLEPLRRARRVGLPEKDLILVVDGLDHAQEFEPGFTILDLLIDYIQPLSEVMRVLVTAASDHGTARQRIASLENRLPNLQFYPLYLQADPVRAVAEMDEWMLALGEPLYPKWQRLKEVLEPNLLANYQFLHHLQRLCDPQPNRPLLESILNRCIENACCYVPPATKKFVRKSSPLLSKLSSLP